MSMEAFRALEEEVFTSKKASPSKKEKEKKKKARKQAKKPSFDDFEKEMPVSSEKEKKEEELSFDDIEKEMLDLQEQEKKAKKEQEDRETQQTTQLIQEKVQENEDLSQDEMKEIFEEILNNPSPISNKSDLESSSEESTVELSSEEEKSFSEKEMKQIFEEELSAFEKGEEVKKYLEIDYQKEFVKFAGQDLHIPGEEGTFVLQDSLFQLFNRYLELKGYDLINVDQFEKASTPLLGEAESIFTKIDWSSEYDDEQRKAEILSKSIKSKVEEDELIQIEERKRKSRTYEYYKGYRVNIILLPELNLKIHERKQASLQKINLSKDEEKAQNLSEIKEAVRESRVLSLIPKTDISVSPPKLETTMTEEPKVVKKLSQYLSSFFPGDTFSLQEGINYDEETLHYMSPHNKADKLASFMKDYPNAKLIVDVFAGIGGNTLGFARAGIPVISYEKDAKRMSMLRNNVLHYRLEKLVTTIRGEFNLKEEDVNIHAVLYNIDPKKIVLFFDPPWLPSTITDFDKSAYILSGISQQGKLLEDIIKISLEKYGGSVLHLPPGYNLNFPGRIVDDKSDNKSRLIYCLSDDVMEKISKNLHLPINYATSLNVDVKPPVESKLFESTAEMKDEEKLMQPPVQQIKLVFQTFLNKDFPRRTYRQEAYHPKAIHSGQRKLLLSEIEFLTRIISKEKALGKNEKYTLLYIGAAPGVHIPLLAEKFPEVKFILYDPANFEIKPNDQIEIHQKLFTDEIVQQYQGQQNLLFVSDIRSAPEVAKDPTVKFDLDFEDEVVKNMTQQEKWVVALQPLRSLLKFRLPYNDPNNPRDENTVYPYLDGIIFFQAYPPEQSGETRLEVGLPLKKTDYLMVIYEQQMFYFNTKYRIQSFKHYSKFFGWSYDTLREYYILYNYYKFRGVADAERRITLDFQEHDRMTKFSHKKIYNILTNAAKHE